MCLRRKAAVPPKPDRLRACCMSPQKERLTRLRGRLDKTDDAVLRNLCVTDACETSRAHPPEPAGQRVAAG
jgi:hypothetical protein